MNDGLAVPDRLERDAAVDNPWKERVQQVLDAGDPEGLTRLVAEGLDPDEAMWADGSTLAGGVLLFLIENLARHVGPSLRMRTDSKEPLRQWKEWQKPWLDALARTGFSWQEARCGKDTLFLSACASGHWRDWALAHVPDVDAIRGKHGRTALFEACGNADEPAMRQLHAAGADASRVDAQGMTLLDVATETGYAHVVALARALQEADAMKASLPQGQATGVRRRV